MTDEQAVFSGGSQILLKLSGSRFAYDGAIGFNVVDGLLKVKSSTWDGQSESTAKVVRAIFDAIDGIEVA